ncbi:MAG: hypothetical protein U9R79_06075 [Armatimonadota bacterium]|nr:hypothetical protein [Armatimonadota bacterium]
MIGGKSWLDLAVVAGAVMGFVTLMLVIQGRDRGRTNREIACTAALVCASVALTMALAWLLESRWGGPIFDVQMAPGPRVVTRSLTGIEAVALAAVMAVLIGLYITSILAVKRLLEPERGAQASRDTGEGERT